MRLAVREATSKLSSGATPTGGESSYKESGVPLIRSLNVRDGGFSFKDLAFLDDQQASKLGNVCVEPGDVLLNITGASVARVCSAPKEVLPARVNQHVMLIRPKGILDSKFLEHQLRFRKPELLKLGGAGATREAITKASFEEFTLVLPPLSEQRRIADILDRAEALRAKRRAALAQVAEFDISLFVETFGDPVVNPKHWKCAPLVEVLERIDSGKSPVCLNRQRSGEEWGVLKLGAATWGEYKASENKAVTLDFKPDPRHEVKAGDLLFVRKNTYDLVGATSFVHDTPPKLLLPDLIFRLVVKSTSHLVPIFLQRLLAFPTVRKLIQKLASGSSDSMPNISKARLLQLYTILPPLPLQQEFARRVQAIDQLKTKHRQSLVEIDALFLSLQHRAFRGEL